MQLSSGLIDMLKALSIICIGKRIKEFERFIFLDLEPLTLQPFPYPATVLTSMAVTLQVVKQKTHYCYISPMQLGL